MWQHSLRFQSFYEHARIDSEGLSNPQNISQTHIPFATLDRTYVGPMQLGFLRKPLL